MDGLIGVNQDEGHGRRKIEHARSLARGGGDRAIEWGEAVIRGLFPARRVG